jgi:Na+-translocating ferredoxin:NAD+ oxidoreductase RNF subunit RnfB
MNLILLAVIVLGAIGLVSALVLFFASHKFAVYEDPRIAQISEVFAPLCTKVQSIVTAESFEDLAG